jgi:rhodanese-related sulfurtransferase
MNSTQNTNIEKSIYRTAAAFLALYIGLAGCAAVPTSVGTAAPVNENAVTYVTPEVVRHLQQTGPVVLIDASDSLAGKAHIPGSFHAKHVNFDKFQLPPGGTVVFYNSGFGNNDARLAAVKVNVAAAKVAILDGGLTAWIRAGLPIEEGSASVYPAEEITPAELRRALRDEEKFLLVDLREPSEFSVSRIDGARNVASESMATESAKWPKDRWIIFYDRFPIRAQLIADEMRHKGFRYTGYLSGGYSAWLKASTTKSN